MRGDLELHEAKNVLEEIWPDRVSAALAARKSGERVHACMNELRMLAPNGGSYVSESNFFENDWPHSYWDSNYAQPALVKKEYDPTGLSIVHNGVGSEEWSADGFTRL